MEQKLALTQSHPSFATKSAWFQFAILSSDKAVRKLLLVEAKNSAAVACIESILLVDGKVSEFCFIVSVFRDCPDIGMRSPLVDEVPYVDFMLDVVDNSRVLSDSTIALFFQRSLSNEEKAYASEKLSIEAEEKMPESRKSPKPKASGKKSVTPESFTDRESTLESALVGLGFHKGNVAKWMQSQGEALNQGSIQDQIRNALAALAP